MEIIKLIDLYKLIASDELKNETKFKYAGDYFKYWKKSKQIDRYTDNTYSTVEYYNGNLFDIDFLNDEVEIIEDTLKEDKKIEKLGAFNIKKFYDDYPETAHFILEMFKKQEELIDKINGEDNE